MPSKQHAPAALPLGATTWLDAYLRAAEMSGRGLAEELGVNEATVSRWRKGLRPSKPIRELIVSVLSNALDRELTEEHFGW